MEDINKLLPQGTLLRNGTYRIEQALGSGGFGNTYLVRHLGLDAKMVVKEFFMKGINLRAEGNTVTVSIPDNHATYESQREKFKKEAQRLWKLKSDHIVGVHDIFEENGTVYYVMELIDGESLEERLKRKGVPFQESELSDILNQLLDALVVIHGNKPSPIFHLDIKPSNILMSSDGNLVLIDFGASKQLSSSHEGVTSTMMTYTKGYAPSEQVDGKTEYIGAWTDLYAVGATLYRLLTNSQPPEPSDIINEGVNVFKFPSTVSNRMRNLIIWLMQPSRKRRPKSVEEVRDWLINYKEPDLSENISDDTDFKPKESITPQDSPKSDKQIKVQNKTIDTVRAIFCYKLANRKMWFAGAVLCLLIGFILLKMCIGCFSESNNIDLPQTPIIDEEVIDTPVVETLQEDTINVPEKDSDSIVLDDPEPVPDLEKNLKHLSMTELEELAKQGNAEAIYTLGWRHYDIKRKGESDIAVSWWEKSAKAGYAPAIIQIGWCYYNGVHYTKHYGKAVEHYKKAAQMNIPKAKYMLGLCYYSGHYQGTKKEKQIFKEAVSWLNQAANDGYGPALFYLGKMYYKNEFGYSKPLYSKAFTLFTKAAEQDSDDVGKYIGECYHFLAECYKLGRGTPKDYTKATEYYNLAKKNGYVN